MNVSATPPTKPHMLDGTISPSRPARPAGGKDGGAISALPLARVADEIGNDTKTPRTERPVSDAPAAADDAPDSMFNVDGLLADWGRNPDSPYDLDGSGEVDGWDLALFLGGEQPRAGEAELNAQGLIDHWGEANGSPYDLDGNGEVDGWDLALFLGGEQDNAAEANNSTSNATGQGDVPVADASAGANAAEKLRFTDPEKFLQRFTKAVFRQAGIRPGDNISVADLKLTDEQKAQLDPDGDGFAKPRDLRDLIEKSIAGSLEPGSGFRPKAALEDWVTRLSGTGPDEELVSRAGDPAPSKTDQTDRREALARLTDFVSERLDRAGFDKQPPRNLHAVLERFDLSGRERSSMLSQLASKYPNGLGVNRVG